MNLGTKTKAKDIRLKGPALTQSVLTTLDTLSAIVGSTLGPGGNVVLLERPGLPPLITKDGVTVAVNCAFADATAHVIGEAAKEAALRTNTEAGDGTTTAIVLAEAMTRRGLEYFAQNPTQSPQEVCRELDKTIDLLVGRLRAGARKVSSKEDLVKVAMVSANFDSSIAEAVVEAIDKVGNNGTIITEEGSSRQTTVELQEGFPVRKGLNSLGAVQEVFINNPQDQECSLVNPLIMLFDGDLNDPISLGAFLGGCLEEMIQAKQVHPILVVAHKFSPQVLRMCAQNFMDNRAQIVPLETVATAQPQSKHHFLHDLAAFVGADVLNGVKHDLESATIQSLGGCGRVKIGRYQTVFLDPGEESEELVQQRIEDLKNGAAKAESEYDAEIMRERIGALLGGIATIYVGGSSDLEIKEKKHRIEDAICATRSAIDQGIIPGGGASLLTVSKDLAGNGPGSILFLALREPFYRISKNAGESKDAAYSLLETIVIGAGEDKMPTQVLDVLHHELVEPYEAGIVDPVKVTISALTNAFSIAQMLFTLGGAIVLPRDLAEERAAELQAQSMAAHMQAG